MTDDVLIKKLKSLITIRVFFITLLLGSFFVLQVGYRGFPYPRATSNLIVTLYVLSIIYSIMLNRIGSHTVFAYIQLFIDAFSTNLLIYLTGGIESWFSFIIPLTVLSASTVLNKRAGYIIATFNSILYGTVIDLQYYKLLPIEYDPAITEKDFLYNIFAHMSVFYLVAFLSGYLSSRLEKTAKALEQADSDLKELAIFNKELIENIPSGIFTTDTNGNILIFNKAAEDITGMRREIAINQKINNIFPFIEDVSDVERMEGIIRHKDGNRIIGLTISTLSDIAGERTGFIGVFQNLTHLKKMEAEIKYKEKWAAIGELSANIAHEIRNPLSSLKGSVEMLKEDRITEGQKEKLMEIALKEMERLNKIITDFLTYSRPKAIEYGIFDLNLLLNDTLELLKNSASVRDDISIRKDFNGVISINADQQKLQQVFWNLGMNALEAMPSGGELSVHTQKENGLIEIGFQDTGHGIPRENMGRIFYPFFTTKDEGTGLGLAIAYRIIEEHKGTIDVSSKPGNTIFKVVMPVGIE
jgi:two-component system sensor histidine kinase PilS (NtrC family)